MKKAEKINNCVSTILITGLVFILAGSTFIDQVFPQTPQDSNVEGLDSQTRYFPIKLSLKSVSDLALANSLDIQIAKFDAYIKRTSLKKEESIFDTFLNAQVLYLRDKKSQSTTFAGTESKEHSFSLGLEKKIPTGTTITVDAVGTKKRTNSVFATLNPYNEASLQATIVQELGKNFFGIADRADIKITKIDIENSDFTSLDDIEKALFKAQQAYWRLVLRVEELLIAQDMVDNAEKLYDAYKNKYSLGLAEESEFLAIEALLYERRSNLLVTKSHRIAAKNNLLFLLNQGEFEQEVIPEEDLNFALNSINLYQALKDAVGTRRDYKRANNKIKKNKIEIVVSKNALWPQIDLKASLIRNNIGLARGQVWEDAGSGANDEISLKLTFKVPLENREAKADLERVKFENAQLLLDLKRTERLILLEINNKVNEINTFKEQAELFKAIADIHDRKLQKQIKRLKFGRSDMDTLIDYEQDLIVSRRLLALRLFDYRLATTELDLIKNSLLDKYWQGPL